MPRSSLEPPRARRANRCGKLCSHARRRAAANGCTTPRHRRALAPEELAISALAAKDETSTIAVEAQGPAALGPPYPFPARTYNTSKGGAGVINVHLVPHSHDDTGWQVTVDQYFANEVFFIIDTVVESLSRDPNRKFIYVETGFFARWWEQASDAKRAMAKAQVKGKQLEFINGAWCMHDEATPLWTAMVDQTTRGHQFLLKNFGPEAAPRGTWQIDPFGHSQTEAWLLGAEAGYESIYWGRMDWQDRQMRFNKEQGTDGFEWIWQGSESLGASAQIFAGNLYGQGGGGYSTWFNFNDGKEDQIIDDPTRHDWNVDQWVDKFVQNALSQANHTLSEHQMWACGTDFQYQNADPWYTNWAAHPLRQHERHGQRLLPRRRPCTPTRRRSGGGATRCGRTTSSCSDNHHYRSGYYVAAVAQAAGARRHQLLFAAVRDCRQRHRRRRRHADGEAVAAGGRPWTDRSRARSASRRTTTKATTSARTSPTTTRCMSESVEVEGGSRWRSRAVPRLDQGEHCNCNAGQSPKIPCAATTELAAFTVAVNPPRTRRRSSAPRRRRGVERHRRRGRPCVARWCRSTRARPCCSTSTRST